jgi:hypothetical protein
VARLPWLNFLFSNVFYNPVIMLSDSNVGTNYIICNHIDSLSYTKGREALVNNFPTFSM